MFLKHQISISEGFLIMWISDHVTLFQCL